jgi:hypothetical protein
MDWLGQALQAAAGDGTRVTATPAGATPPGATPPQRALLVGAGGRLGSALLAEALVAGRFASVAALVAAPLASTLRGLRPLVAAQLEVPGELGIDLAFIVLERERFSNGRDDAFVMPQPAALPALAQRLREGGVRRLLVVLPHASAMLPAALAAGLASHDEAAVAAFGFEHLVLLKPSQDVATPRAAGRLARLARWWLSQLRWMVPERELPLPAQALARFAVRVAQQLPRAAAGTHVLPQGLLWQLSRDADGGDARLDRWLARAPQAGEGTAAMPPAETSAERAR